MERVEAREISRKLPRDAREKRRRERREKARQVLQHDGDTLAAAGHAAEHTRRLKTQEMMAANGGRPVLPPKAVAPNQVMPWPGASEPASWAGATAAAGGTRASPAGVVIDSDAWGAAGQPQNLSEPLASWGHVASPHGELPPIAASNGTWGAGATQGAPADASLSATQLMPQYAHMAMASHTQAATSAARPHGSRLDNA